MTTITPHCPVHGRVDLPADAVYLRRQPAAPGSDRPVVVAVAICEGHVLRQPMSPTSVAALRAAGVREPDDATWALLMRLASPVDDGLADVMLAEVEDVPALRLRFSIQSGRHLYRAVDADRRDHVVEVAREFGEKLRGLGLSS